MHLKAQNNWHVTSDECHIINRFCHFLKRNGRAESISVRHSWCVTTIPAVDLVPTRCTIGSNDKALNKGPGFESQKQTPQVGGIAAEADVGLFGMVHTRVKPVDLRTSWVWAVLRLQASSELRPTS